MDFKIKHHINIHAVRDDVDLGTQSMAADIKQATTDLRHSTEITGTFLAS